MIKNNVSKKSKKLPAVIEKSLNPQALIMQAIEKGVSIEILNGLFDLQKRVNDEKAAQAYREAMSGFQAECPIIAKKREVRNKPEKGGGLRYKYAPIEDIGIIIKPLLQKYGLSYNSKPSIIDGGLRVDVQVWHVMGHSETSSFQAAIDTNDYMTNPQRYASTYTFCQRYALCAALGIVTGGYDNDANNDPPEDQKLMAGKIQALPEEIKSGFRVLKYGVKAAHIFAEKYGWDERKIAFELKKILESTNVK